MAELRLADRLTSRTMNSSPLGDAMASSEPDGSLVRSSIWTLVWRELAPPLRWKRRALPESKENSGMAARGGATGKGSH